MAGIGIRTKPSLHDVRQHEPRPNLAAARICISRTSMASRRPMPKHRTGGARRDRTDDLLLAKQALSQLSYGPGERADSAAKGLVGPGRLERPTSRLSGVRSNHLSYGPPGSEDHGWPKLTKGLRPDRAGPIAYGTRPRRKRNEDGGVPPNWSLTGTFVFLRDPIEACPKAEASEGSSLERR